MPTVYNQLINLRYSINYNRVDSIDAVTIINDVFPSSSPFFYCINYIINLIRMLFPIELILKGIKYIPFIVYQIYFSVNIIKKLKEKDTVYNNKLFFSIIIAYILTSNLYEPDFGSLIRHETALMLIIFDILIKSEKKINKV